MQKENAEKKNHLIGHSNPGWLKYLIPKKSKFVYISISAM